MSVGARGSRQGGRRNVSHASDFWSDACRDHHKRVCVLRIWWECGCRRQLAGGLIACCPAVNADSDPTSGPARTRVGVSGEAISRCFRETGSPSPQPPRRPVGIGSAQIYVTEPTAIVAEIPVSLFWDGKQLPVEADEGYFFVVPEAAAPGRHVVVSQCTYGEYSPASADFTVIPPPTSSPSITPPPPLPPASSSSITPPPASSTTPPPTDTRSTAPHSAVAPPAAQHYSATLTVVPNLVGSPVADASGVLGRAELILGRVSGAGEVVRGQQPIPGAAVPRGSGVDVITYRTGAPQLVIVPNLVGRTVDEARRVLDSVGLVLGNPSDGSRTVSGQSPAAGTLTQPGSTVTVTVSEAPLPVASTSTPWWWWPLAVLALLFVAALVAVGASRAHRGHRWARAHVRAEAGTGAEIGVEVEESQADRSPPSCVVRIEPHADSGTQVLKGVEQ